MCRVALLHRLVFSFVLLVPIASEARDEEQRSPAESYVRAALHFELANDLHYRDLCLRLALRVDPDYEAAHWQLGHVRRDGEWLGIQEVISQANNDERLQQYRALRDEALDNPERELELARWCQRQRLPELAEAYYRRLLLNLDTPAKVRREAMRSLRVYLVDGQYLTREQLRERHKIAEEMEQAVRRWRPRLERFQKQMNDAQEEQVLVLGEELAKLEDPTLVPALESFIVDSGVAFGTQAVRHLGRFEEHEATQALVRYAVLSPWEPVRLGAIDQLRQRDLHEYVPMLLEGLVSPIKSQWSIVRTEDGGILYRHSWMREGVEQDVVVTNEHLARPRGTTAAQVLGGTPGDVSVRRWNAGQEVAEQVLLRVIDREQDASQFNFQVLANNAPIFWALEQTTYQALPHDPARWWQWWQEYNEVFRQKPTQYVYRRTESLFPSRSYAVGPQMSSACFAPGTLVWTETGLVPIERIQVGDRVLSQNPNTGELTYKAVLRTTSGAPTADTVDVRVEGDTIRMTAGHVVWVAGSGWRMAKELKPGDTLRQVRGPVLVEQLEEHPRLPAVHNMVVDDFHTYFVGQQGVLVHDITYRQPTQAVLPGLLAQNIVTASR